MVNSLTMKLAINTNNIIDKPCKPQPIQSNPLNYKQHLISIDVAEIFIKKGKERQSIKWWWGILLSSNMMWLQSNLLRLRCVTCYGCCRGFAYEYVHVVNGRKGHSWRWRMATKPLKVMARVEGHAVFQ